MIRTETQVPSNYYAWSRDFQLLGRLFDLVANSSKNYADNLSSHTDGRFAELMSKTVGFGVGRKYDTDDLLSLHNGFKSIMRKKGSKAAISECVELLMHSQNVSTYHDVDYDAKKCVVTISVGEELRDIALLEDLLEYVLPAGWLCDVVVLDTPNASYGDVDANVSVGVSVTRHEDADLGNVYSADATGIADSTKYETPSSTVYGK